MLASSSEFDLLLIGITLFAALGFSFLFSKLKQPVVIGQPLSDMIVGPFGLGLVQDLASSPATSLGLHLLAPQPTAQPAQLLSRPIETPLEAGGLIPTQEDGGLV